MYRHYIIIHREPKGKPSATAKGASKTKTDKNRAEKNQTNKTKEQKKLGDWGEQHWSAREKKTEEKKEQNCSVTKPFEYTRCQGLARFPVAVRSLW